MAINTNGLTGYAAYYADARNRGFDDASAHMLANSLTGGSGVSVDDAQKAGAGVSQDITTNQSNSSYAATDYDAYGRQLAPVANSLLNPAPTPVMPKIDLQYQQPVKMDWQEAWQKASGQIDPQYKAAKNTTIQSYATQRENLPQYLNARGQLYGGLRVGGESAITNKQAAALEDLQLNYDALKQQTASSIQDKADYNATELAKQLYQQQVDQANLDMSNYNNALTQWNMDREFGFNALKAALEGKRYEEASAMANQLDRDKFDWQKESAMMISPYDQAKLDLESRRLDMDEKELAYNMAKPKSSGSGGSSGKTPSNTEVVNAIRNGAIQYAQGLLQGTPFTETRGLNKGKAYMSDGETPENAAKLTIKMLQSQLGTLPISSANYNDIVKQIYLSLGLEPPKNSSSTSDSDALSAALQSFGL